jgi:hypothetical protein
MKRLSAFPTTQKKESMTQKGMFIMTAALKEHYQ